MDPAGLKEYSPCHSARPFRVLGSVMKAATSCSAAAHICEDAFLLRASSFCLTYHYSQPARTPFRRLQVERRVLTAGLLKPRSCGCQCGLASFQSPSVKKSFPWPRFAGNFLRTLCPVHKSRLQTASALAGFDEGRYQSSPGGFRRARKGEDGHVPGFAILG